MSHAEQAPATEGRTIRGWARWYDALAWLVSFGRPNHIRDKAIRYARVQPGSQLLDVGCGTGSLVIRARSAVGPSGDVCGIDASPEMVEIARRKARKRGVEAEFLVGAAEQIPYLDERFDSVVSTLVFHHLPAEAQKATAAEMRRVLKPGGTVVIADFSDAGGPWPHRVVGLLLRAGRSHSHGGDPHANHGATSSIAEALTSAGFDGVQRGRRRSVTFVRGTCHQR